MYINSFPHVESAFMVTFSHAVAADAGRGEDPEEGSQEDPQQAVSSRESQEEEGVRRRLREQVR